MEWLSALEWDHFIELVQKEAYTEPGKAQLRGWLRPEEWAQSVAEAQALQEETQEVTPLLDRDALWGPLTELTNPGTLLKRLEQGAVLEIEDLGVLRRWLYAVESWIQVPREEIRGERFKKTLSFLPDPLNILRILEKVLTPEGELSEEASPLLAHLHREVRKAKKDIEITLDQLLKRYAQAGVLQESFSDVRDGRYVLPVKISSQGEVEGIVHEASVSRQTVFIEPQEVTRVNNHLRQLQNQLIQEIYTILENTCKQLMPFVVEIKGAVECLIHWDSVQAKARLGRHYAGKTIHVNAKGAFSLRQTAHPLLWWALSSGDIVRNDVDFGQTAQALLITGPNTGGKTVLLKTLGLAGICARTGFPFPATDHPSVPFFGAIFTDLGDPQSIEKHLSTFSGHVLKMKEILEYLGEYVATTTDAFRKRSVVPCLVLIDELNSSTDPEEGAAFGRAVIETILARGGMLVSTTHDPRLKALAFSDNRICNASMEFQEDDDGGSTGAPTYRMTMGVPGRSRALETARRFGISLDIIDLARTYLSKEHEEFERLIGKLEADLQETSRAKKEALQLRKEAELLQKEWTQKMESTLGEITSKVRQKVRRVFEQAQDEVREVVKRIEEMKGRGPRGIEPKEVEQIRAQLNEGLAGAMGEIENTIEQEAPELTETHWKAALKTGRKLEGTTGETINIGSVVRIPKWKTKGTVVDILAGNKVKVAMGTVKMILSMNDIELPS